MIFSDKRKKRDSLFFLLILVISLIIFFLPSPIKVNNNKNTLRGRATVLSVDNSEVAQFGIVKTGEQSLIVKMLNTDFKGQEISAVNTLMGKLEFDKIFTENDTVLVTLNLSSDNKEILFGNVVDHYRINLEVILFVLFLSLLVIYSGWTGLRAIISFIFTGLMIWKVLIPGFLLGISPILLSNSVVALFTAVIIFLIAGFNRTGVNAFVSALSGIIVTTVLALIFGSLFKVHGAVKPFTEMLLYAGYPHLDITSIFLSGIFIASSGAVMDISMDISASMKEVLEKKPNISHRELFLSGVKVGRAVIGTMTTTLLLAYSGGYTGLLMVFMAQGTPALNILNLNYVSAEILHTLVGSFGLVTVAPLTAFLGSFILLYDRKKKNIDV